MPTIAKPLPELRECEIKRFRAKFKRVGECLVWTGAIDPYGYGVWFVRSRSLKVHRVAYFLATGIDPAPSLVLHSCDNPPCCEPAHLSPGDQIRNVAERDARERRKPPKGVLNGRAKLTPAQVREIRALEGTMSQEAIAARFGVYQTQVSRIMRRKAWAS